MPTLDEVRALLSRLAPAERELLARELAASRLPLLSAPTAPAGPVPHSPAWVRAERGHAVLATDTGPPDAEIPAGWQAIVGMWRDAPPDSGGAA